MIVLVECFHDAALAKALGVTGSDLRHASGRGDVVRRLRKAEEDAIGLIDADPGKGGRPRELDNYQEKDRESGLRLLVHRSDSSKRVIEVNPWLEVWLVARAGSSGVSLSDHGLPDTGHALHGNARRDRDPRFRRFLQDLLAADTALQTLKKWLR